MGEDDFIKENSDLDRNHVAFDYIKSSDFRVVWVDGGVGSITPNGLIHVALFAERHAIPRREVYEIQSVEGSEFGTLGPEIPEKKISRASIVRQMDCDLMMKPETAENLAKWLLMQAEIARKPRPDQS